MNAFKQICLAVLLTSQGGIMESSPDYIQEKIDHIDRCTDEEAFALLDVYNMARVAEYCDAWHYEMPKGTRENMNMQTIAAKSLGLL